MEARTFRLLDHLGMGQFGNVWRAHDSILDRIVALKIPRGEHLDDELFFREARAAAQLQHPNIVSVHEVGQEGDTVYIACDFVQGANLQKPPERRYLTAAQLAADLLQKGDGHFEDLQLTVTLVDMAASTVWGMRFVSLLLLAMLAAAVYLTYI